MWSSNLWPCFVLLAITGCPTRDQLSSADAGAALTITSPAGTAYTNGSLAIAVHTADSTPETISINAGGTTVGTISPPETTFTWDTTSVDEGSYVVTAMVTVGAATRTSNPVTVVVDRTRPTVALNGLVPSPGTENVKFVEPLSITFSEPILRSSISNTFVSLQAGSATLGTTVTLSPDGTFATVAVAPAPSLSLPQTVTASFAASATDLAGNPFEPRDSWQWTIPGWIKLAPFTSFSQPILAVGSDSRPVVLYSTCTFGANGCAEHLRVAVNVGDGWNDLGEPATNATATGASLALDLHDRPVVTTPGRAAAAAQVLIYSWSGSAWDGATVPPIDVPPAAGYFVDQTKVRLDSIGRPVVAYRANTTSGSDLYVARWTGAAWDMSYGGAGLASTQAFDLILDDQDAPVLVTTTPINGVSAWTAGRWVKRDFAGAGAATAVLDTSGAPMMLTSDWRITHLTGGTWLPIVPIAVPVAAGARAPGIAATPDRRPVVAWAEPAPAPGGVRAARWTGSDWDLRSGLANGSGTNLATETAPRAAVDRRGSLWLAWLETNSVYVWMSNY